MLETQLPDALGRGRQDREGCPPLMVKLGPAPIRRLRRHTHPWGRRDGAGVLEFRSGLRKKIGQGGERTTRANGGSALIYQCP